MRTAITKSFRLDILRQLVIANSPIKAFLILGILTLFSFDLIAQVIMDGKPAEWPNALNNSAAATFKRDVSNVSNSSDDQFTNGSADPDPISGKGGWTWNLGNTNNKTDITNAGAVLYTAANQDIILAFFADRTINNGSAEIHTWFFRSSVSLLLDGSGKFSGVHTADQNPNDQLYTGDILIVSEFTQGGAKPLLKVYNWIGGRNPLQLAFTIDPSVSTQFADAAVNAGPEPVPSPTYVDPVSGEKWEYTTSSGVAGMYPIGDFFEAALNLTKMNVPACFTTFMTATRNSPSQNASLQDFAIDKFEASPPAPGVDVLDKCDGTSVLTAKNYTGTLLWSTGETTASITVTVKGTYTVSQTIAGCTGNPGSGDANPKTAPLAPAVEYLAPNCDEETFSIVVGSTANPLIEGAIYTILDKNDQTISTLSPASPYSATAADATAKQKTFSGIPAGKGYKVSVENNGCPSTITSCQPRSLQAVSTAKIQDQEINLQSRSRTNVIAAPNPFNDRIRFSLKSEVSGRGSLELYNTLGQRVKTVFQGQVTAGQVQTIEYAVPGSQRSNLIYVFRVGTEQTSGKLVGLKQ
ncbi:hypothetical protein HRH25_03710 [Flavisolibacter sp. BT320]|nr:hypothetical protein [Flavisolibacter longurius]